MNSLDLTPTWAGLLPAFFAMLESGTGEGPAIAKAELARLAAWADSHNAQEKAGAADLARREEEAAEERNRFGLASVALGRERAGHDLARHAKTLQAAGLYELESAFYSAAAIADKESAGDYQAAAIAAKKKHDANPPRYAEERRALSEGLQNAARDSYDSGQYRAAGAFYRAADMARPSPELRGMAQEACRIADSEALARRAAAAEAARLLERAESLAGAIAKDAAPHWRQFRQEARAALRGLAAFEVFPPIAPDLAPADLAPASPSSSSN